MAFSSTCKSSALIFFSFEILFIAISMKYVILPVVLEDAINKSLKLIEGNQIYNVWYNPPNITVSKFYFFHIENPDEIRKGGKPKVQEIGPFVHETKVIKKDIVFLGNDEISYGQWQSFVYNQEKTEDECFNPLTNKTCQFK